MVTIEERPKTLTIVVSTLHSAWNAELHPNNVKSEQEKYTSQGYNIVSAQTCLIGLESGHVYESTTILFSL